MGSRLADSPSPYLRQHADNPVDWHPWGDDAFALARRLDRPVFLSIGYSSCHWCHVMAHESFEDERVARVLNDAFVSVKVDREERPDVDQAYMTAVQIQNGHGGWPMSVFLTPDRKPFFAGTYLPKEDRGRHPGFVTLLQFIARKWSEERAALVHAAEELSSHVSHALQTPAPAGEGSSGLVEAAIDDLAAAFDHQNGGFGSRPKFPPHTAIHFLLSAAEATSVDKGRRRVARQMAEQTLFAMALGGIHDHVGGGFARYSTDERWHLPHFEKMLSDNAQLLRAYVRAGVCAQASAGIVRWLREEMTLPDGTFATALDADAAGEEGSTYTWTLDELRAILGNRADEFAHFFGATAEGNYRDEATGQATGRNVLHASSAEADHRESLDELRKARSGRPQPVRDDKAVACWNGMAIRALAEAGEVAMAERAARVWRDVVVDRVPRHLAIGRSWGEGFLEDYAHLALGFCALASATTDHGWLDAAKGLVDQMTELFFVPGAGFSSTSERHESLFARVFPWFDEAQPSGNGSAIEALIALGRLDVAREALRCGLGWMRRAPSATESLHECLLNIGPIDGPETVRVEWGEVRNLAGRVCVTVPTGMHLNPNGSGSAGLLPTALVSYPPGIRPDFPRPGPEGYVGRFEIGFRLPKPGRYRLVLSYQCCTDRECLPPEESEHWVEVD